MTPCDPVTQNATVKDSLLVVFAGATAFFALCQWLVYRAQVKLTLFALRHPVYLATRTFLAQIVQHYDVKDVERSTFLQGTRDAVLVFPRSINEYLEIVDHKALDMQETVRNQRDAVTSAERERFGSSTRELFDWFEREATAEALARFSPHLVYPRSPVLRLVEWLKRRRHR